MKYLVHQIDSHSFVGELMVILIIKQELKIVTNIYIYMQKMKRKFYFLKL